ncbi:hypothetical protein [Streptomyces sp. NPDC002172]
MAQDLAEVLFGVVDDVYAAPGEVLFSREDATHPLRATVSLPRDAPDFERFRAVPRGVYLRKLAGVAGLSEADTVVLVRRLRELFRDVTVDEERDTAFLSLIRAAGMVNRAGESEVPGGYGETGVMTLDHMAGFLNGRDDLYFRRLGMSLGVAGGEAVGRLRSAARSFAAAGSPGLVMSSARGAGEREGAGSSVGRDALPGVLSLSGRATYGPAGPSGAPAGAGDRATREDLARHLFRLGGHGRVTQGHLTELEKEMGRAGTADWAGREGLINELRDFRLARLKGALLTEKTLFHTSARKETGRNWAGPATMKELSILVLEQIGVHNYGLAPSLWVNRDVIPIAADFEVASGMVKAIDGWGGLHRLSFGELAALLAGDSELTSRHRPGVALLFTGSFMGRATAGLHEVASFLQADVFANTGKTVFYSYKLPNVRRNDNYLKAYVEEKSRNANADWAAGAWLRVEPGVSVGPEVRDDWSIVIPDREGDPIGWTFRPEGEWDQAVIRGYYSLHESPGYKLEWPKKRREPASVVDKKWPGVGSGQRLFFVDAVVERGYVRLGGGSERLSGEEFARQVAARLRGVVEEPVVVLTFPHATELVAGGDPLKWVSVAQALATELGRDVFAPSGDAVWALAEKAGRLTVRQSAGGEGEGLVKVVPEPAGVRFSGAVPEGVVAGEGAVDGEAWAYRFSEPAGTVREPGQGQGANTGGLWEASALSLSHSMPWMSGRATSRPISRFEALAESAELPLDEVMRRAGFHTWHAELERYRSDFFDHVRHVLSLPSWEQPSERHLRVFAAEVTALRTQNQFASIIDVRKARFEDLKLALLADDTRVSIGRRDVVAAGRNWMGPGAGGALSVFDLESVEHNGTRWPAEWAARDTYLLAARSDPQGRMVYAFDGQGRGHYVSFGEVASLLAVDTELQSRGQVTDVLFVGGFLGLLVRELRSIADAVGRAVIAYPEGLRLQGSSHYGLRVVTQGVRNPHQWERVRPQRRPLIVPGVDGGPTVWAFRPDGEHTADYMARSSYLEVLRRSAGYLTRSYDTGEFNWQPWPVMRGRERLYIIDALSGGPDYVSNTNGGRWISAEEFADAVQYAVAMEVPEGIIPVFVLDFQVIGATPDGWDPLLNVSIPQALANRLGTAVYVPVGMTEWSRGSADQHLVLVRPTGDTSAGLRVFVPEISESPSVKTQISSLSELGVRQAVRLVKEFVNNEDGRARELWTEAAFELFRKLRESRNYSAGVPYPFSLREVVEFAHENPEPAFRSYELRQVFGELLELTKNGGLRAGVVPVSPGGEGVQGAGLGAVDWEAVLRLAGEVGGSAVPDGLAAAGGELGGEGVGVEEGVVSGGSAGAWGEGSGFAGGQVGGVPAEWGMQWGGGLSEFGEFGLVHGVEGVEGGLLDPAVGEFPWGGEGVQGSGLGAVDWEAVLRLAGEVGGSAVPDVPAAVDGELGGEAAGVEGGLLDSEVGEFLWGGEGVQGSGLGAVDWEAVLRLVGEVGGSAVPDGLAAADGVLGEEGVGVEEGVLWGGSAGAWGEGSGFAGGQVGGVPTEWGMQWGGGLSEFGEFGLVHGVEGVEGGLLDPEVGEFPWGGEGVASEGVGAVDWEAVLRLAGEVGGSAVPDVPGEAGGELGGEAAGVEGGLLDPEVGEFPWGGEGVASEGVGAVVRPADAAGGAAGPEGVPAGQLVAGGSNLGGQSGRPNPAGRWIRTAPLRDERVVSRRTMLQAVRDLTHWLGEPPTDQEIAVAVGKSEAWVKSNLRALHGRGFVIRKEDSRVVLRLTKEGWAVIRPDEAAVEPLGPSGLPLPDGHPSFKAPSDEERNILKAAWGLTEKEKRWPTGADIRSAVKAEFNSNSSWGVQSLQLMGLLLREYHPRELELTELGEKVTVEPTGPVASPALRLKRTLDKTELRALKATQKLTQELLEREQQRGRSKRRQERQLPMSVDIEHALGSSKPIVQPLLRELEIKGFLDREEGIGRRGRGWGLTEDGLAVVALSVSEDGEAAGASGLSPRDLAVGFGDVEDRVLTTVRELTQGRRRATVKAVAAAIGEDDAVVERALGGLVSRGFVALYKQGGYAVTKAAGRTAAKSRRTRPVVLPGPPPVGGRLSVPAEGGAVAVRPGSAGGSAGPSGVRWGGAGRGEGGLVGAGQPADGRVGSSLAGGRSRVVPAIEGVRLEGGPSAIEEFDLAGGRGGVEGRGDGLLDPELEEFLRGGQEVGAAGGAAGLSGPLVGSLADGSELTPRHLQILKAYRDSPPGQLTMKMIRMDIDLQHDASVWREHMILMAAGYLAPLEGKPGKYTLGPKGRKLFGQSADVAVGPAVSDDQISERVPQYQEVLKAIGEFRRQKRYGPVTKEVTAKVNETAAEKVDDDMVRSVAARMRREELLTGETACDSGGGESAAG